MMLHALLAAAAIVSSWSGAAPAAPSPQDPAPVADLAEAFTRAADEGRRVLLGVYTAGEARSEDFAKRVLRDKAVRAALAETVPVHVLLGTPTKTEARRFGGLDPDAHRALERAVRDRLPANAEGVLASPQHAWFGADGELLIAAPYELEPEEFVWLDWRSQRLAGAAELPMPRGARAPRRYLEREAFAPVDGDRFGRGLLPAEIAADLELMRRRGQIGGGGGRGGGFGGAGGGGWTVEAIAAFTRLAFTDVQEAQDEVRNELGNVFLRFGGGTNPWLEGAIELVAYAAPRRGAESLTMFLNDPIPALRARSASALESLGYDGVGWSDLRKALDKEEDAVVRRALLRAAGVVGRNEAQARRTLEKEVAKGRTPLDRAAALIGLGHVGDGAALESTLRAALGDAHPDVALAAAGAMALTRDGARFRAPITERSQGAGPDEGLYAAALAVLDGAPLTRLRELLQRVAPDDFPRSRLYFTARPPAGARGIGPGGGSGDVPGGGGGANGGGNPGGGGGDRPGGDAGPGGGAARGGSERTSPSE